MVNDGLPFGPEERRWVTEALGGIPHVLLNNSRAKGAAGAWNTGLSHLLSVGFEGFVAILDDDDTWDPHHLETNLACARKHSAAAVISGLRMRINGIAQERRLPEGFNDAMFLAGNPGWQGSNTFVAQETLAKVGGFRDGLASLNDRDLAIRLLRQPSVRVAYTGAWTATWHASTDGSTLSSPRSCAKLKGLQWFWRIYGAEMSKAQESSFFQRARDLFHIEPDEIRRGDAGDPHYHQSRGDLTG